MVDYIIFMTMLYSNDDPNNYNVFLEHDKKFIESPTRNLNVVKWPCPCLLCVR